MEYPKYVDPQMREILNLLGKAIVPREKRKAVVRTNYHRPYYSRGRDTRI